MVEVRIDWENFDGSSIKIVDVTLFHKVFSMNIEGNTIEQTKVGTTDVYTFTPSGTKLEYKPNRDFTITCNRPEVGIKFSFFGTEARGVGAEDGITEMMRQIIARKTTRSELRNLLHAEQAGIVDPRARRNASKLVNKATQPALHEALMRPHGWQEQVASFLVDPKHDIEARAFNIQTKANGTPNAVGIGAVVEEIRKEDILGGKHRTRRIRKGRSRKATRRTKH